MTTGPFLWSLLVEGDEGSYRLKWQAFLFMTTPKNNAQYALHHSLHVFLKKMGHRLFSSFQTNITIFTAKKWAKCPFSIRCWDSNPRPLEHESPPITTRPGPPPTFHTCLTIGPIWLLISVYLRAL